MLLAEPDPRTGGLSIFGMTKVPVFNRDLLAAMLGMDAALIHVHAIDAGGGFGVRGEFYPEDFLVPWLARTLGRPVKWVEDRAEHLVAANHSRQQSHRVAAAFDSGGRITALTDEVVHDNGAYCRTHGIAVPELTLAMLPGPYRVPAYRGRVRVVLTNKTPCGTYRAPGRYRGDHRARAAARRRRRPARHRPDRAAPPQPAGPGRAPAPPPDDHPRHRRGAGRRGLPRVAAGRGGRAGQARLPRAGRARAGTRAGRRGLGVAVFLEKSGLGPHETADVTVSETGAVRVLSGGTSLGQGIETVLAQIAADALGVGPQAVDVVNGDTDLQPCGTGSWASRSTVVAGNAVHSGRVRGPGPRAAARRPDAGGGRGRPG